MFAQSSDEIVFDDIACDSLPDPTREPEPHLATMLKARRLFPDNAVYRKSDGARIEERRYRGLDSWLNDDRGWQRDGQRLIQRTLFWGPVVATATVDVPARDGDRALLELTTPDPDPLTGRIGVTRQGGKLLATGDWVTALTR